MVQGLGFRVQVLARDVVTWRVVSNAVACFATLKEKAHIFCY